MYLRNLAWLGSLSLCVAACSSDPAADGGEATGGQGSSTGGAGTDASGGAAAGGTPGVGGDALSSGGAGPAAGGAVASGGSGPASGGDNAGGTAGGGGASGGVSGDGGSPATGGGGGGGNVGPGPSDLPPAPGADDVPIPSGAPGNLTVIDWAGFPAAVTYSFDDNDGSQLNYYDEMHAIGGRYTFYLVSDWGIDGADWQKIHDDGNEIGNHTTNHSCSTQGIDGANAAIESTFGAPATTLAAPNGDSACTGQAAGRVFINRGVSPAQPVQPLDNSNPFQLNCYIPATGQAASAYNSNIDSALSQNGWVIYVIHGINPGTTHTFQPVSWDGLKAAMEYAKSKDVWMDTMENVGSYWLGQKVLADAQSTTTGDSTTWTWTLPDKFPAEKYLRVTVDGGTLTQGGTPLTWDPHGYYEVALDEGSLTLAP